MCSASPIDRKQSPVSSATVYSWEIVRVVFWLLGRLGPCPALPFEARMGISVCLWNSTQGPCLVYNRLNLAPPPSHFPLVPLAWGGSFSLQLLWNVTSLSRLQYFWWKHWKPQRWFYIVSPFPHTEVQSVSHDETLFKSLVGIQNVSLCYFVPNFFIYFFSHQHHLQQLNVFQASLSISGMPHRPLGRAQSSPATASVKGAPMGEVPIKHLFTTGTLLLVFGTDDIQSETIRTYWTIWKKLSP